MPYYPPIFSVANGPDDVLLWWAVVSVKYHPPIFGVANGPDDVLLWWVVLLV
jgi:hypothetical protein